jgi:hypothetical protein
MPDRTRGIIEREAGGRCALCGEKGMTLALLVSFNAGGHSRQPNLLFVCRGCHKKRDDLDVLELAQTENRSLSAHLSSQRVDALSQSPQHLISTMHRRTIADCRAHLSSTRWLHPRVPFLIATLPDRVLIAALQIPTGEAGGRLLDEVREAGGRSETEGVWSIGCADWNALAWRLIDRHAILYRHDLGFDAAVPNSSNTKREPWRARWDELFDDLADLRRGEPRKRHRGFQRSAKSKAWVAAQGRGALFARPDLDNRHVHERVE